MARLELRTQPLTCSTLTQSWLVVTQQGYHVQKKTQNPSLTKQTTENEGPSENMGYKGKTV